MMQGIQFMIAATPDRLDTLAPGITAVHMSYRIHPAPRLMRQLAPVGKRGGLMYLPDPEHDVGQESGGFLRQVIQECAARGFSGVVADLSPGGGRSLYALVGALDRTLSQKGLSFYVPEGFSGCAPNARLLISSAVSGGSLERRLEEAKKNYGTGRIVLALEQSAEDFVPPCSTGRGRSLSREELAGLRRRLNPGVFWSSALCARYFTYSDPAGRTHFVLFDDPDSLKAKVRLAGDLGISRVLAAREDLGKDWFL